MTPSGFSLIHDVVSVHFEMAAMSKAKYELITLLAVYCKKTMNFAVFCK
jgi:hypothetical protein